MNRIQTRALVEGAIFAAITVVIGVIRFYIPIISLISIVWAVPTILIAFRHGFKVSIASAAISSVLVAIVTQPIQGLGFFIGFGLPGIIMGYLLKRRLSPGNTILVTGIALAVCGAVSIYLGMLVAGVDVVQAYDKMFTDMKNAYGEMADSMANMPGANREEMLKGTEAFEKSMEMVKLILPGGILLSGIMMSFVNFKLTRIVLKRINYFIEDVKPFAQWRLSNAWMVFATSMLIFAVTEMYLIRLPQLYAVTMNIFTVATMIFAVLGVAVIKFFLDKYPIPKGVKGVILFFVLLAFRNIIFLVGILDISLDFRKLRSKPVEEI